MICRMVCGMSSFKPMTSLFTFQLLLINKNLSEVHGVLSSAGAEIEKWSTASVSQKESLKVFFLVLQVYHFMMAGQVCFCWLINIIDQFIFLLTIVTMYSDRVFRYLDFLICIDWSYYYIFSICLKSILSQNRIWMLIELNLNNLIYF